MKGLMTVAKHVAVVFKKEVNFTAEELSKLPHDQRVNFLSNKLLAEEMPGEVGPGYVTRFLNDYMNSEQLLSSYQMKPYDGPVVLFVGNETTEFKDETGGGWFAYAPNMRIITVTGHHDNIVSF
jgi:thioesterase domain-containing protein